MRGFEKRLNLYPLDTSEREDAVLVTESLVVMFSELKNVVSFCDSTSVALVVGVKFKTSLK